MHLGDHHHGEIPQMAIIILYVVAGLAVLIPFLVWAARKDLLLRIAGVDPQFIRTAPDRARYNSMGAVVLFIALAATASLTLALTLVFPTSYGWLKHLPIGILWGSIVFCFDRWIVSSIDYGPLSDGEQEPAKWARSTAKYSQFLVRFLLAVLVGLVISEPIVLAVFGPEIKQQLTVQHLTAVQQQTAQINAASDRRLSVLEAPVKADQKALAAATTKAQDAHKVYICELTGVCHLPPGEVTGIPGDGPQARADYAIWQTALRLEGRQQQILNKASARERAQAKSLQNQTTMQIAEATKKIDSDNGLLAREEALDTLSKQNPGFLLRRIILWLALMFVDLVPVLLKTFAPPTLYERLQRGHAIRLVRNEMGDAVADSDHESAKRAVARQHDLEFHKLLTSSTYARSAQEVLGVPLATATAMPMWQLEAAPGIAARTTLLDRPTAEPGWIIGRRWLVRRPLTDAVGGSVPFIAADLYHEYPFDVVVKIIAPPPGADGTRAASERRHAQMEMSLPQGLIHDNIAEVLDRDVDQQYGSYIVTRLYPLTLEHYLRDPDNQDKVTLGIVLRLGLQILDGLRAAWDLGFVHLDLKPANVALTADGTVKLIDFGLAQQYQKLGGGNGTTSAARYTMFYAPPEQMERRDSQWISRNADVRALGAVIYRMLTGYPPMLREARALGLIDSSGRWPDEVVFDLKKLVREVEPVPVSRLIRYIPPDLDAILQSWLRTDPDMRSPGNPETLADRMWHQLGTVAARVRDSSEAGYPVGPRVVEEPDVGQLRQSLALRAGLRQVTARESDQPLRDTGFHDPTTIVPQGSELLPDGGYQKS
jgi:serine/threonine protein kinase